MELVYRDRKTYLNKYRLIWRLTPRGKASTIWTNIKQRCENKNGDNVNYTNVKLLMEKEEFLAWVIPELEKWQKEYDSLSDASIDRIKNDGHYELGNLQLLTKNENTLKRDYNKNPSAPEGFAWCGKCKDYLHTECFYPDKSKKHGLSSFCKMCKKQRRDND